MSWRPDSTARSAARSSRSVRSAGSVVSRAERSSVATAIRTPPRRCVRRAADSSSEATESSVAERKEALDTEVDDLLDEIDDVLETNAEDFVKSFIQKGGE